ncbi:MAG: hypothetical protein HUK16_07190 [Bacteroidales bacterium]|nr:hypothetical protein [Bacteroidales bacterium]
MDNNFNNSSLIQLVKKWKWHIIIITAAAAICGAIFSGPTFIKPLYKSEAIAYPANISPYSDESETEQMLQLINAQSIMDSIVAKHDLWTHYGIDRNYKFAKTYLMAEYNTRVNIKKTPYEAISITVSDTDPVTACNIAKDILYFYNQKVHNLHTQKDLEVVNMYAKQLQHKQDYIDSLKNDLATIGLEYGVTDYVGQSREVTRGYLNGSAKATELKKNLEQFGPNTVDLRTKLEAEATTYVNTKVDYEQALRFYNSELTYYNIVSEPFPADRKAFPIRWVIIAITSLSACLLSILIIIFIENRKRLTPEKQ